MRVYFDAGVRRVLQSLWTVSNFTYDWAQIKDSLGKGLCALLPTSRPQPAVYLPTVRAKVLRLREIWQRM